MKRSLAVFSVGVLMVTGAACSGNNTHAGWGQASSTSAPAAMGDRDVIVLMRDQIESLAVSRGTLAARATAIAASHAPLIAQLQAMHPRSIRSFEIINGLATRMSQAEIDKVSARPEVLAVVSDRTLKLPARPRSSPAIGALSGSKSASTGIDPSTLCNTLEPEALQVTNTAFLDPKTPQAQTVIDGNGQAVTGTGVTVGILADGLDTTIQGFVRPDGTSVFVDYQDFTGDPAGTPTAGGEMFGDASSIAAQDMPNGKPLTFDIGQFGSGTRLPSPCNIRIRGMAPGAALVGLKVFSQLGYTTTSSFVQAIGWAVVRDQVDVINESFGGNVVPDDAQDPISLANAAAIRAGVTVSVATGDAGSSGTLGSPGTDPRVIAAGASTQFRLYAQTSDGVTPLATGWINDNVSAFSSGGFAQYKPRSPDVLAPGDLGWALCSTNNTLYQDCQNYAGGTTPIEVFGGTSEAAPLTAGAAALVIQAYRSTHGGQSPSPALVKTIIQSTASDVGAPSDEQGAGRIDALAAVNAALSVQDEYGGARRPTGTGLLASPSSAALTVQPGDGIQQAFQITNTGATTLHLQPSLEQLGSPIAGASSTLQMNPTSARIVKQTFTVPEGADHLDAAIAFQPQASGTQLLVIFGLLDPQGRQAAYSVPQGLGSGYGHVDVVKPAAGTWTAVMFTGTTQSWAYTGPVQLTWSAERYVPMGDVYPSSVTLPPGTTTSVIASFQAPSQAGDSAAALRFHGAALSEIPVTLRTLVPIDARGGSFTGTLTGGNARQGASPTQTYAFDVPGGVSDMALNLSVDGAGYGLVGFLVDPNGVVLDAAGNIDASGAPQNSLQLFRAAPQAGRWRFVLEEPQAGGNQTSIGFKAKIAFGTANVSATGLPTSRHTKVSASQGQSVTLTVTNTGAVAKAFFADARLATLADVTLPQSPCGPATTLPGFCSASPVPPRVAAIQLQAQSTVPINMDAAPSTGDPDVWARQVGKDTVAVFLQDPEVPYGAWYMWPALVGPFGPAGAPTENVTTTATVSMQPFDTAVTASSGDYWADQLQGTSTYNPLVLAPGASGAITLTIKPDAGTVGRAIAGSIYVDTANTADPNATGDEVVGLPYAYTVAP